MLFQGFADSESVTHKTGTSDFNFVVAGDFSCNKEARKTVNNMATKKPEIMLTVGDHSYRKSADCWFDTVSPLDIDGKLKIAFGEHDIDDNLTKYKTYLRHFNLTDPYYSFDYQNVHFLAMATAKNMVIPYMNNSTQYDFVKNDLKSAHENKNINWIVVLSYRPLYSSISIHSGKAELQDLYHPLFHKYGVDVRSLRYPGLISYKSAPGGGTTDYAVEIYMEAKEEGKYECFLQESTYLPMMYMPDAIRATIELMEAPKEKIS
jgi:hypothetical protein